MSNVPYGILPPGSAGVPPAVPVLVAAPPPPPRRQINPLLPLCCIGLVLFLIAATIVLALIPIYLSRRGDPGQPQNLGYTTTYRLNNGTLLVGPLSASNCAAITADQQNLAASDRKVRPSVPVVTRCAVTGNASASGGRRRRQTGQPEGNLIVVEGYIPGAGNCFMGRCLLRRLVAFIVLLLTRDTFFLTLTGTNGTSFVFSTTVLSANASTVQTAAQLNDIAILNYALVLENLEASFYTRFQTNYTAQNFIAANFTQQNFDYLNIVYVHEVAHVQALTAIITQLGGTPLPACTYNFSIVTDVRSYLSVARVLENTGTMAYDGAVNGIADPTLRQIAATVATVEARHASYLNLINGLIPFPDTFENASAPLTIVQAISPFIVSCPFTITAPTVPYIGSTKYAGSAPTSNSTSTAPYTNAMYTNDIRALNYALIAEQLEAAFYNQYVSKYTSSDYTSNGFADASTYFQLILAHENAHVQYLRMTITQRQGTPVPACNYTFTVNNVSQFIQTAGALENTGVKAYDGVIGAISDPDLILAAATVATVEARHAAYLNQLQKLVPFPDTTDQTLTPTQVAAAVAGFQSCSFTPDLPVVLNPSNFTPSG